MINCHHGEHSATEHSATFGRSQAPLTKSDSTALNSSIERSIFTIRPNIGPFLVVSKLSNLSIWNRESVERRAFRMHTHRFASRFARVNRLPNRWTWTIEIRTESHEKFAKHGLFLFSQIMSATSRPPAHDTAACRLACDHFVLKMFQMWLPQCDQNFAIFSRSWRILSNRFELPVRKHFFLLVRATIRLRNEII